MHSFKYTAILALSLAVSSHSLKAAILADTNRDGKVDVLGDSDIAGKETWTEQRGALFLANIGDTNGRCSYNITDDTPDMDLDKCHDAFDNVQRNPKFLAPLRTVPDPKLTDAAQGFITLSGRLANEKVRLFYRSGDNWTYINKGHFFKATELRVGLELGIDARDVRRPNEWDGRASVHFNLTDNGQSAVDQVELRVAPVLTHHTLQNPVEVFTSVPDGDTEMQQFVATIENYTSKAGIKRPVVKFKTSPLDIWTQDFFEPGYTSIPGPSGPVVLGVMIRSSQLKRDNEGMEQRRKNGRRVFSELRSATAGAVQYLPPIPGRPWDIDSLGNLETIPPYTYHGKSYPAGRAIMGKKTNFKPLIFDFLEAQESQHPIVLDHDWLLVGHTDEYMQFLPANTSRGWVMTVDDPIAGLILKKAQLDGHGNVTAMSRPHMHYDQTSCLPSDTIDNVLRFRDFEEINNYTAARIQFNIDIVKNETGLSEDEIVRIPAFYHRFQRGFDCERIDQHAMVSIGKRDNKSVESKISNIFALGYSEDHANYRRAAPRKFITALYPATINGIVYANGQYLAPNPWGPIIDGKDIIAHAVTEAYAKVGVHVDYMDDWFDHHEKYGDIHCGTNVARDAAQKWW